jgi:[protein-PII] uridylyltransferase
LRASSGGSHEHGISAATSGASGISRRRIDAAVEDVREGEPMCVFTEHRRSHTDAVILCMDRPNVLAQLSAAILGADANIVDASIETRRDVVIDRFRLVDIVSGSCLYNEQVQRLRDMVLAVCTGTVSAEEVYQRSRRKWQRRLRRLLRSDLPVDVKYIDQQGGEQDASTIIEVYAPDTFGLLYTVAHAISSFGLNIVFAKIATRVDGVVDSFYVQEPSGQAFVDAHRRELLRTVLLQDITRATQTP